jgi:hypothetical protein
MCPNTPQHRWSIIVHAFENHAWNTTTTTTTTAPRSMSPTIDSDDDDISIIMKSRAGGEDEAQR